MKILLILIMTFSMGQTHAQDFSESEDIERLPVITCNVIKTPFYLYRAQANARKIPKCWTKRCVLKKSRRTEKNFCKAMNSCDSLSEVLKDPCTPDNKLTAEAKAEMKEGLDVALDYMTEKALVLVEKIKDEIKNRGNN